MRLKLEARAVKQCIRDEPTGIFFISVTQDVT